MEQDSLIAGAEGDASSSLARPPGSPGAAAAFMRMLECEPDWQLRRLYVDHSVDTIEASYEHRTGIQLDVQVGPAELEMPAALARSNCQVLWRGPRNITPQMNEQMERLALGTADIIGTALHHSPGILLRDAIYGALADLAGVDRSSLRPSTVQLLQRLDEFTREVHGFLRYRRQSATDRPGPQAAVPAVQSDGGRAILTVKADCQQNCNFCGLREVFGPSDGGSPELSRLKLMLRLQRAHTDTFVLNGNDPLAFSGLFDLLAEARSLQYVSAEVYSPCTVLADEEFCDRLLDALPAVRHVHVPLYALSPEIHEGVVGRPGSYDLVRKALDLLMARLEPSQITLTTVYLSKNLEHVPTLLEFAHQRGLRFFATMPYPSRDTDDDRIAHHSPRQSEVARLMVPLFRDRPASMVSSMFGVSPCLVFAEATRSGVDVGPWIAASPQRPSLNGAGNPPVVACAEAAQCSLAFICPTQHFQAYRRPFGAGEFRAITDEQLSQAVSR